MNTNEKQVTENDGSKVIDVKASAMWLSKSSSKQSSALRIIGVIIAICGCIVAFVLFIENATIKETVTLPYTGRSYTTSGDFNSSSLLWLLTCIPSVLTWFLFSTIANISDMVQATMNKVLYLEKK